MSTTTVPTVVLEPIAQQFADSLAAAGGPPIYDLAPQAARDVLDKLQSGDVAMAPADISDITIHGGSQGDVSVTIVRPKGAQGTLAAVVYIHGGGWILGNFQTHERMVRELADQSGAAIVFVNYTPSPEAQYPVAVEQSYTAAQWVAQHGAEFGLDASRLLVAGDSVGGAMAAAVTILAKERGGPAFLHQVLLYPVTDARMNTASYTEFAAGPWLTQPSMVWFWNAYIADDATLRAQPTVSPLQAPLETLAGLPPALVVTDEADVLRDEGEAYGRKLREAGVDVTAVRFEGIHHDFMMLNALADTNAARDATALAAQTIRAAIAATGK
ncbi:MAG: alpha/beta hydrolase [Thermomicrobiales bacterium]